MFMFTTPAPATLRSSADWETSLSNSQTSFLPQRRDFRLLNLDDPCECGIAVPIDDMCLNTRVLFNAEKLEETSPGEPKN